MPKCASCRETSKSEFYKDRRRPNGYQTYCKSCAKKRRQAWAKKNPSRIKDYYNEYYKGLRKDPRKWAERLQKKSLSTALKHLTEQVQQNNRRARKLGREGKLTLKAWYKIVLIIDRCPGCKRKWALVGKPTIDHVRPLVLKGTNTLDNIQPLCKSCNSRKRASIRRFVEKKRGQAQRTSEDRS